MKGLAATHEDSCGHHADLRNIPTVQLGESLTSLYISDHRPGHESTDRTNTVAAAETTSASGSRTNSASASPDEITGPTSKSPGSRKGKEKARTGDDDDDGNDNGNGNGGLRVRASLQRHRPSRRDRDPSDTSVATARANSSAGGSESASVTPSIPQSASLSNSYSAELYDSLTPLRDAMTPSTSKRRSVPIMGPVFEVPVQVAQPSTPSGSGSGSSYTYSAGHVVTANHALSTATRVPNASPTISLSEILATPSYREVNASHTPEYTQSPFERHSSSTSVGNANATGRGSSGEIDYFNLPLSHREGSMSAHMAPGGSPYRGAPDEPSRPQSEPLPEDSSTPSWSSSDITSLTQSSSLKSPRIRNEGMLAPHGSFTSESGRRYQASAKLKRAESLSRDSVDSADADSVQSWRSRTASERSTDGTGRKQLSEKQYLEFVKDAMNGDQLALYHLGWGGNRSHDRHSLGDAELVWGGAVEPTSPSAFSSRSSATSRPSLRSASTSYARSQSSRTGPQEDAQHAQHQQAELDRVRSRQNSIEQPERPKFRSRQSTAGSDLFADVAHMTLASNARNNNRAGSASGQATPPPMQSPSEPPRSAPPAVRRSSHNRPPSRPKAASSRSIDPVADKPERVKDPVKEQERKEERERRRALRAAARKLDSASSASGSTMR